MARLRIVPLPEGVFSTGQEAREGILRAAITEHFQSHQGQVPAFGAITGYVLVLVPGYGGLDFGVPYDCDGIPTGPMIQVGRLPVATLGLKAGNDQLARVLRHDVKEAK